jgi:uncharacterized protein (TIGR03067 family)
MTNDIVRPRGLASLVRSLVVGGHASGDEPRQSGGVKPADLVGEYRITRGEREGVPEPRERLKGSVVRFSNDRVVVVDAHEKELYGAEYSIETGRGPSVITMTSRLESQPNLVTRGLIDKNGDTVRLIYALPGGNDPTSFLTGPRQLMFEMKKKPSR